MFTTAHFQVIQAGQRPDLVQRHGRSIADTALAGSADDGVLHAVSDEDFQVAVVEQHRNVRR